MQKLPTLFHKAKGGDLRQWRVFTDGADILTEYGTVGGKLQISRKTAEAKNAGRKNATTPDEQAVLEAQSLHTYKLERKYSLTPEDAQEQLPLPMLAHSFKGSKRKNLSYEGGVDIQPKLDGVRCLAQRAADGSIALTSRQGKPWTIPLVQEQLANWLPEGITLDGELYTHGESCQRITSWAKSAVPGTKSYKPESARLIFHVYDMPVVLGDDTLSWKARSDALYLKPHFQPSKNVERVPTVLVANETDMWSAYGTFVTRGYEGAILRSHNGTYIWGYRSAELLKVKEFQDAEFEVVDVIDGIGKMKGHAVFVCRNDVTDATFECLWKGSMPERRRQYEERQQYIGKILTVRFFDRTDDQIPRIFVGGIVFRDPIDLP